MNATERQEDDQFGLLAHRVSENFEELVSTVTQYIEGTLFPNIAPSLREDLYDSVHANIANLVLLLQGRLDLDAINYMALPEGVTRFAQSCARHGYSVTTLTLAYHQGQNAIERAVLVTIQEQFAEQDAVSSVTDHFDLLEEAMSLCHEFLLIVQGKVVEVYNLELENLFLPGNTATLETVNAILAEPEKAPQTGEVENYSLDGQHAAAVVWMPSPEPLPASESVEIAQKMARVLGSTSKVLVVFPRPGEMWVWMKNPILNLAPSDSGPAELIAGLLPKDARVAFGPSAKGAAGFAYAHAHAPLSTASATRRVLRPPHCGLRRSRRGCRGGVR